MFDLEKAARRAEQWIGRAAERSERRRCLRRDRGIPRSPKAMEILGETVTGHERPGMPDLLEEVARRCRERGVACPSRASVYAALPRLAGHLYRPSDLPPAVQEALYNLAPDVPVPGRQVAFYCFNYGSVPAVCFAAGLPWLDLYQAAYMRGFRPKSRGLLEAVCRVRRI
ncbi:MAG: hypothetical protein AB1714_18245 [Acidobacteriota bacterium]